MPCQNRSTGTHNQIRSIHSFGYADVFTFSTSDEHSIKHCKEVNCSFSLLNEICFNECRNSSLLRCRDKGHLRLPSWNPGDGCWPQWKSKAEILFSGILFEGLDLCRKSHYWKPSHFWYNVSSFDAEISGISYGRQERMKIMLFEKFHHHHHP